jgi:hypothetical protein
LTDKLSIGIGALNAMAAFVNMQSAMIQAVKAIFLI